MSDYCFDKLVGDALSNKKLRELIRNNAFDSLHLCGLDECGCVTSTALGASKRGIKAQIIKKGTATVFSENKVLSAYDVAMNVYERAKNKDKGEIKIFSLFNL